MSDSVALLLLLLLALRLLLDMFAFLAAVLPNDYLAWGKSPAFKIPAQHHCYAGQSQIARFDLI